MVVDAAEATTEVVEKMHRTIRLWPLAAILRKSCHSSRTNDSFVR
jgi:hypothetical protein